MPDENTTTPITDFTTGTPVSNPMMPPVADPFAVPVAPLPEPSTPPAIIPDSTLPLPDPTVDPPVSDPFSTPEPTPAPEPASEPPAPTPAPEPTPAPTEPTPSPTIVEPLSPDTPIEEPVAVPAIYTDLASKISEAHNVLVALSSDPSVDEMAAAIGLSLFLDKLGKRVTAIYSGATPNALEFLKPEETFSPAADTLQDFVIALNKEKADHLRYKLDGDYVKIYITPYLTKISPEDLEFSYGDYNVDLVLALDVANGIDLDSALREHGRIMHDAVIINITTGNPGKFGEIEWSDKKASSVSEMIAKLLYSVKSDVQIGKEEATAFLTGIVAATNRFSNAHTTPETMQLSSKLMRSGANQQLISRNITPDVDNELFSVSEPSESAKKPEDPTKLDIEHGNEKDVDETKEVSGNVTEKASTLLDDLKAAEADLAKTGAEATPDLPEQTVRIENDSSDTTTEQIELNSEKADVEKDIEVKDDELKETEVEPTEKEEKTETKEEGTYFATEPAPEDSTENKESSESEAPQSEDSKPETTELSNQPSATVESTPADNSLANSAEKVIAPPAESTPTPTDNGQYDQMLAEALAELTNPGSATALNPAAMSAPAVATNPEINGVPEMNYMPLPGDAVLPPPPTPPIDMSNVNMAAPTQAAPAVDMMAPIQPAAPAAEAEPAPLGPQPAMQDQVYHPQVADPAAFKIPGT